MTTLADIPVTTPDDSGDRRTILTLAALEAKRLMRHPVLAVGIVAYAIALPMLFQFSYADADFTGEISQAGTFDFAFMGALLVGVFGFVAAYRITRSTSRTAGVVDAAPVSESRRSMALCLACLAPFAVTTLGVAVIGTVWVLHPPVLDTGWFQVTTAEKAWDLAAAALAGLGGPVLGVAVARWWRWPSAVAVTAAVLVAWCASSSAPGSNVALRLWHGSAPFTIPDTSPDDVTQVWQGGSLEWRFLYVCGLIALAAVAAVAHGTTGTERRRLQNLAVVAGIVTVAAFLLAVFTGPAMRTIWP